MKNYLYSTFLCHLPQCTVCWIISGNKETKHCSGEHELICIKTRDYYSLDNERSRFLAPDVTVDALWTSQ